MSSPLLGLHVRSYTQHAPDAHSFAQLVLPLAGRLSIDIDGRGDHLDPRRIAFVAPQAWHTQIGDALNRAIILDLDLSMVTPEVRHRLMDRTFRGIGEETGKLIDYMGLLATRGAASPAALDHWMPLLLDSLTLETVQPASRLSALTTTVEAEPGRAWTTERMAAFAGLSVSRLHALFRETLDTTPHAWLRQVRVRQACDALARTVLPLAEIALRNGFSDQSALTRAVRDATGLTPSAYRRRAQEKSSKIQD